MDMSTWEKGNTTVYTKFSSVHTCFASLICVHTFIIRGGNKIGLRTVIWLSARCSSPDCMWTFSPEFGVIYQDNWKGHRESGTYAFRPATLMLWCSQGLRDSHEITGMCWTSLFEIFGPLSVCHCMKSESEGNPLQWRKQLFIL